MTRNLTKTCTATGLILGYAIQSVMQGQEAGIVALQNAHRAARDAAIAAAHLPSGRALWERVLAAEFLMDVRGIAYA